MLCNLVIGLYQEKIAEEEEKQAVREVPPKTTKTARLSENIDLFGFELSQEEVSAISALNKNMNVWELNVNPGDKTREHHGNKDKLSMEAK